MARKQGESESGICAFLGLVLMGLLSCYLIYMGLSYSFFNPRIRSTAAAGATPEGGASDECCRGVENLELWGATVKWGSNFKKNSSLECCMACKDMCAGDGTCRCDSWVHCGDRQKCGDKFGECWLRKQKDPLIPDVQEAGQKVIWTSGLIFGNTEGIVRLETGYGVMHIKLLPDCAPRSVAYILDLLRARHCAGCQFYRAEGRGSSWDSVGNHILNAPFGPPFALVQGTLAAQGLTFSEIPKEACPSIRRGSVAWVSSGPEFFISLANHNEWKGSYTVFGSVVPEDMDVAEKITRLPIKTDSWGDIKVSVLEKPVNLEVRRITKDRTKLQAQTKKNATAEGS